MNYDERIVCFIDILGFKHIIENTVDIHGNDIPDKIKEIDMILYNILDFNRNYSGFDYSKIRAVTQFSDSVVISFKVDLDDIFITFSDIQYIIMNFFKFGYIIRGGICYGKVIHTTEKIFGPAMVKAYEMESKEAIYPRVLVSSSIIQYLKKKSKSNNYEHADKANIILELINKDMDNLYYIDFLMSIEFEFDDPHFDFADYLMHVSKTIKKGLCSTDNSVLSKYQWLAKKYNKVVEKKQNKIKDIIQKNDKKDYIDLEQYQAYLQLPIFNIPK